MKFRSLHAPKHWCQTKRVLLTLSLPRKCRTIFTISQQNFAADLRDLDQLVNNSRLTEKFRWMHADKETSYANE